MAWACGSGLHFRVQTGAGVKDENSGAPNNTEDGKTEAATHKSEARSHTGGDCAESAPPIERHGQKAANQHAYTEQRQREERLQQTGEHRQRERLRPTDPAPRARSGKSNFRRPSGRGIDL
ncbi:MAG: hypothetical protein DMG90_11400 [Acidobacteria bacterium]|nr:MAG: hypothetical protein DMG90_11400 [Acidobacteriota bacterium]